MTAEGKNPESGNAGSNGPLRITEKFYRSVFEQVAEGIVLHDMEGNIFLVNPSLCESLGYSREELQHMSVRDIDPYVVPDDHRRKYWDSLPLKKTVFFESEHRRKDGTSVPVEVHLRIIELNKRKYILASVIDIADRQAARKQELAHLSFLENLDKINRAIQASTDIEQMMTDVLDTVLSIFDCDRAWLLYPCDTEVSYWTVPMERTKPEFPRAFAMKQEITKTREIADTLKTVLESQGPVVFGRDYGIPLPQEVVEKYKCQSQIAMALHPKLYKPWMFGLHQCSYPRRWSREEERLMQAIGRRLEDALGSLLILNDLGQSEQRYRATFEQSIDSIVLINTKTGQIEDFNDNACRNLGYTREEFERLTLRDIESEESQEDIFKHLIKIEKEGIDIFETKHRTKTGNIRDVLVSTKIITVRGRTLVQGIFRDITEQKNTEEKRREYHSKLKSFAAASWLTEERERKRISHGLHDDIGQKLAVAKLDLLSSLQGDINSETAETIKSVCSEIEEVIESVRSFTFELSNPVLTELGLEAALERHLTGEILGKHGIVFELEKCGQLNQLDEDISMCLFRSIRELLNNVVKHSKATKAIVSLDKSDNSVMINVRDNGIGFEPESVSSRMDEKGGFGLFSIREQVESFSGELNIESAPGRGSSFIITIPLPVKS